MQPEQIIPFVYEDKKIRVVKDENGEPWFVAKDVCNVLGIDTEQIRRLDDDEKGLRKIQTPGGFQNMSVVNEPGLYELTIRSNKPEAKPFRKWVTHEVLPAIRKTGTYILPGKEQWDGLSDITIKLLADETESAFRTLRKKYAVMGNQGRVTINATYQFCFEDGSM